MMKYLLGSSGRPSPIHTSRASGAPPRKFGNRIALSFAAFKVPCVLYASLALGRMTPVVSRKSPSSNISMLWASPVSKTVEPPSLLRQSCFLETGNQINDQILEIVLAPHRLPEWELGIELLSALGRQLNLEVPDQRVKLRLA